MKMRLLSGLLILCALSGAVMAVAGCASSSYRGAQGNTSATLRAPARSSLRDALLFDENEIWVIARPDGESHSRASLDPRTAVPIAGALMAESGDTFASSFDPLQYVDPSGGIIGIPMAPAEQTLVAVPLEHTRVESRITGYIATVEVTQQFYNPFSGKIEAVYVFPLPQNAAINEFVMTIGERKIRGIIRERAEAEQIYHEARAQGYVASLLTQQRPNIFTQKIANIEPGKRIDVNIRYFHTLKYDDGWYEWVFPMVVGPRFNPPGSSDPIRAVPQPRQGDFSRTGRSGPSAHGTDVPYLTPDERSGHDISLAVDITAGVAIEEVVCRSHAVEVQRPGTSLARIRLSPRDAIPNKDFVLRWRVAGDRIKTAIMTQRDPSRYDGDGHFTLMIYPPAELAATSRQPLELVFVMDCSGSMKGEPIAIARKAVERALHQLDERDSFQIIRFSEHASSFAPQPLDATPDAIRRGVRYVKALRGQGGTMMIEGIKAALDGPPDLERQRYVVFLTDGFIGNEAEILGEMKRRMNGARVFSFGIGSSPNRFLLERMAAMGDGAAAFVGLNDSAAEIMDRFIARVAHPAVTDIAIDFGDMQVRDVFPVRVPDLFVGRPVILSGRFEGDGTATVQVQGRVGERTINIPIEVDLDDAAAHHDGIASVWGRTRIAALTNRAMVRPDDEIPDEIRSIALSYGLMSAYTAFIAVDASGRTAGEHGTTIPIGLPVPDGVRYETTVVD